MKIRTRLLLVAVPFVSVLVLTTLLRALAAGTPTVPYMNLDFEVSIRGDQPFGWYTYGGGYEFKEDPTDFHSGTLSLQIHNVNAPTSVLGDAYQQFPIELVLWLRVDGVNGTISIDNGPPPGPPMRTTDWTRYEFDRDIGFAK